MKTHHLKSVLIVIFLLIPIIIFCQDSGSEEKNGIIAWIAGLGGVGTIITWLLTKLKKITGKIKEVLDVPEAIGEESITVFNEINESVVSVKDIFELIENAAEKQPDKTVKELWDELKEDIKNSKKEISDIGPAFRHMLDRVKKEIKDIFSKKAA